MPLTLLIIHMLIALGLVFLILIQRSEGGGLGIGGDPMQMMGGRGTATILTRATAWMAVLFMASSLLLTMVADRGDGASSIIDLEDASQSPELLDAPPTVPIDDLLTIDPIDSIESLDSQNNSLPLLPSEGGRSLPTSPPIE